MARVLVTYPLPGKGLRQLQKDHQVDIWQPGMDVNTCLIDHIGPYEALLTLLSHRVDRQVIEAGDRLKIVSNYAVGYNNIDIEAARKRRIWVTNTPDVLTNATADLTFSLILACARRIVEGDNLVRRGNFHGWLPDLLLGTELSGKTIGIVGMGRIGQAVAQRAVGFGLSILYYDESPDRSPLFESPGARPCSFEDLLHASHILTLHVPLVPETHHLIGRDELELLPEGAIVINTSRGPVIDEEALVEALESGHIGYAGLDVYEEEPAVHPGLVTSDRTVLLPHLGSATLETRSAMADLAVKNILNVLAGNPPETPVFRLHS